MNRSPQPRRISRRVFTASATGLLATTPVLGFAQEVDDKAEPEKPKTAPKSGEPFEAPLNRDYGAPDFFTPQWKNPQVNRTMAADFVIYAHKDLSKVQELLELEPGLLNASVDWGNGDYETALGGASHMGRKEIVKYLLSKGARIDIFCAAMMGMLGTVTEMLTVEPALVDAKGPHGFTLHFHAQVGGEDAKPVLDYLQTVKPIELGPTPPFLRGGKGKTKGKPKSNSPKNESKS